MLLSGKLHQACYERGGILLSYPTVWQRDKARRELRSALSKLATHGMRLIQFPEDTREQLITEVCSGVTSSVFFIERGFGTWSTPPNLPTVIVCPTNDEWVWSDEEWRAVKRAVDAAVIGARSPVIVIAPDDAPDTNEDLRNPDRTAHLMWNCRQAGLMAFLQEYSL